jgi:pre-mRNA 3'-end-processing factor FIP1
MPQGGHFSLVLQPKRVNVRQFFSFYPYTHISISEAPPQLTTEYTPHERGAPAKSLPPPTSSAPPVVPPSTTDTRLDDGPDPSTLPPAPAPPSHPSVNPDLPGILDGRSILEVDLSAMAEKPWRRPGSDISDWFNYGFDEISWEAYCYRRRDLGELANVLKTNVLVRIRRLWFYVIHER